MRLKRILTFALFALFGSGLASDVFAQYRFDLWTTANGLPQNSVNAILQTRDGYLWIATHDGLVRFDGLRFTVFDRGSTTGIKSNRFTALFEDSRGALWAGTEEGLLTVYSKGAFRTLTETESWRVAEIIRMEEDEEGGIWITSHAGLSKWSNGRLTSFALEEFLSSASNPPGPGGGGSGNLWWSVADTSLRYVTRGRVKSLTIQDGLPSLDITSVYEDQYGALWMRAKGGSLIRFKESVFKTYEKSLPQIADKAVFEDKRGGLWMSIGRSDLDWLGHISDGRFTLHDSSHKLPIGGATVFYEDREGSVWIGTNNGLYRARATPISVYSERDGLASNLVYSILQDGEGAMWIGTWGGGLNRYRDGRFTRFLDGLASPRITCLYEDRAGVLWVGAHGGLSRLINGKPIPYPERKDLFRGVWAISEDRAGNFWFATENGLVRYAGGDYTIYTTKNELADDDVKVIYEDGEGNLWIGTQKGLSLFSNGKLTSFTKEQGFPETQIRAIYEDGDGVIWIGAYDSGLIRFADGKFTRYTRREGLFDNGVFQILEDGRGNIWMGCNKGIYRVSRRELNDFAEGRARSITSIAYGAEDGLLSSECNGGRQPAGWKASDGRLWFPTMGGIAVIDPRSLEINTQPPPLVIEEFRLDNEAIAISDSVEIGPGKESFEIRYAGLSFINPDHIKFRYRLEGLDEKWTDAANRRVALYSHVPPGEYLFTVIAANSDGIWNATGASLRIVVVPRFYQTGWFLPLMIAASVAIAFLIIILIYRSRISRLQKAKALQEAFSKMLIGSQENERKRVAAELHDGLSQSLAIIKTKAQMALLKSGHIM